MSLICIKVRKKKEEERCLSFGRGNFKFLKPDRREKGEQKRTRQESLILCITFSSHQTRKRKVTMAEQQQQEDKIKIGVLALQGSFREHCSMIRRCGGEAVEIRSASQLEGCQGMIIPGGESTTMANIARRWNLFDALREFEDEGERCVWGTCAGLIFLADRIEQGAKQGGQELLGGINVDVSRNFFGSQIDSFETTIPCDIPGCSENDVKCRAIFIRAPAIKKVGENVEVLAKYYLSGEKKKEMGVDIESVVVAVKQKNLLATSFHPELTSDLRWHELFMRMSKGCKPFQSKLAKVGEDRKPEEFQPLYAHPDLPVFKDQVIADVMK